MVIDLMNLAFRSYHGFARQAYLSSQGKPTFMCYGTALALNRLLRDYGPDYVIVATDGGGKTFRHEMYAEYKGNRKPPPDDFISQLPDLFDMLNAYGFHVAKVKGVEADDLIGTISTRFASDELEVYIVSGDKDFMQLVNKNVSLIRHAAEGYQIEGAESVMAKFGCRPDQVVDALAIIGDAVDAIPGVKGIGEKGAAGLIKAFGSLENIYANLYMGLIKPGMVAKLAKSEKEAYLSKKLATIDTKIPLELDLEKCKAPADRFRRPELIEFYTKMGFKSLIQAPEDSNAIPDKFLTTFGEFPE
jgi:DNA polymerase-1